MEVVMTEAGREVVREREWRCWCGDGGGGGEGVAVQ